MLSSSKELWLAEQARNSSQGSDTQLSWLLTAVTLFPSSLDANINLFRVLRSQEQPRVAAVLLSSLIFNFGSSEVVSAELKSVSDDADEERYNTLLAMTTDEKELEKIKRNNQLSCSIIENLTPDIQAVVKLRAIGKLEVGSTTFSKRAAILCSALDNSPQCSTTHFSDAFVSLVCTDLLEKLLSSPAKDMRRVLCDKIFPSLFRTRSADLMPHPIIRRLPVRLVVRCLHLYIGHVLLAAFNSSTVSLVSIDRQWQPCLTLTSRVLFSCLNYEIPSFFSPGKDMNDAGPTLLSLDVLNSDILQFAENYSDQNFDMTSNDAVIDTIATMLTLVLLRNTTAYFRSILHPEEGELLRPVLLPCLNFIQSDEPAHENLEIEWPSLDDTFLSVALSHAFRIWNSLLSMPHSSQAIRLSRRVQEIFVELSSFFDEEDPLKYLDQFRIECFVYKGKYKHAVSLLDASRVPSRSLFVQRILCLAASGSFEVAAKAIVDDLEQQGNSLDLSKPSGESGDAVVLTDYMSSKCFIFTHVTTPMFCQVAVTVLFKTMKSFWPLKGPAPPSLAIPSTLLMLAQADNWPLYASFSAEIIDWLYLHVTSSTTVADEVIKTEDLLNLPRIQALLQIMSTCVFRSELLEYFLALVSATIENDATKAASSDVLSTVTTAFLSHLSTVAVSASSDPHAFALNYTRVNSQAVSSIILTKLPV